ncbi:MULTISPECIES: CsbD family protein [Rhodoferax]|uniref:CsbD family protein n=1 Tax=Rhodoferax fermentans TaxID=28066 RepID=A0A1T1AWE6_RHOFE|nr:MULTISPECIES: CsbD family protein [Rhodoferax]MBK1685154.1 CsbD family protein [Rhodoferax fermentans]OOV08420.1 CsbD family protein [Rhodoferax fermentans]
MNKDQVKGQVKDIAGKVQEGAGKLVDSKEQQAKGAKLQVEGKIQKGFGDLKEVAKDARDAVTKAAKSKA